MAQRLGAAPQPLAEARRVVVGVDQIGVDRQGAAVGGQCLLGPAPILEGARTNWWENTRTIIGNRFITGYANIRRLVQANPEILDALPEGTRNAVARGVGIKTVLRGLTPQERAKRFLKLDMPAQTEQARERLNQPTVYPKGGEISGFNPPSNEPKE